MGTQDNQGHHRWTNHVIVPGDRRFSRFFLVGHQTVPSPANILPFLFLADYHQNFWGFWFNA
jgi:hypothetical protein